MTTSLRNYQQNVVDRVHSAMMRGVKRILIQSPTGSGKTLLTAHMIRSAMNKRMGSWFVVHRRELIKQSMRAFAKVGVPHGIVASGFSEIRRHIVQLASVQSLARRFDDLPKPRLIVWDEAHHIAAGTWKKIFEANPQAYHIGLTATPQRLDGTGLREWFDEMIEGPSVSWLIENKFLAPYRMFAPPSVNLGNLHTRMGDYIQKEVVNEIDKPKITGDAIREYLKFAKGKRAVVFCASIEHSKHVSDLFNSSGIASRHVDGETDPSIRDEAVKKFSSGEIQVLCNVELFGEGFDLPELEVAILLRPTQSLGLYLQQVGRALRPSEGKRSALLLDHAGNCERHGLPDDERSWTLDGRRGGDREKNGDALSVRICPRCFGAQRGGAPVCKYCGFTFEQKGREVENVDGELSEVDPAVIRRMRMREQGKCQTFEELVEYSKKMGHKRPYLWAKHIMDARKLKAAMFKKEA